MKAPFEHLRDRAVLITDGRSPLAPSLVEAFGSARPRIFTVVPDRAGANMSRDGTNMGSAGANMGTPLVGDVRSESGVRAVLDGIGREHRQLDAALVPLTLAGSLDAVAEEAFLLVTLLQEAKARFGALPRYVVALAHARDERAAKVGAALTKTLAGYAAAHVTQEDTRVNVIRIEGAPSADLFARASRAALALTSGWLEAVRGQELVIGDR
ncbi:MAG: hypothetical protein IT384_12920 [Deltaproteobacteria bacterium]|nr:hypothetical protein [Deltaproteobacteria bacterium]